MAQTPFALRSMGTTASDSEQTYRQHLQLLVIRRRGVRRRQTGRAVAGPGRHAGTVTGGGSPRLRVRHGCCGGGAVCREPDAAVLLPAGQVLVEDVDKRLCTVALL